MSPLFVPRSQQTVLRSPITGHFLAKVDPMTFPLLGLVAAFSLLNPGAGAIPVYLFTDSASGSPTTTPSETLTAQGLVHLRLDEPTLALPLFDQARKNAKTPPERIKSALLGAKTLSKMGKPADALALLSQLPSKIPAHLDDIVQYEKARAGVLAKTPNSAAKLLDFIANHPNSRYVIDALRPLAQDALAKGDTRSAIDLADRIMKSTKSRDARSEAAFIHAMALEDPERHQRLRQLFINYPDTRHATKTGFSESDLNPNELEQRAKAFFNAMEYIDAQRIRQALWDAGHQTPERAYDLAKSRLFYTREDGQKALEYLEIARQGRVIGGTSAHTLFAKAYAKIEDYDRASAEWSAYLAEGGRAERDKALYYLGWLPYDHEEYEEALPHFDRFLAEVKKSDLRSYVIWAKGWSLYRLKRFDSALKVFETMRKGGNNLVAGKGLYWGAMAHKAMGRDDSARAWFNELIKRYPLSYYSVLAAKRRQSYWKTPLPTWITGPALSADKPLWPFDRLPKSLANQLRRVKDLSDIGEIAGARAEYAKIEKAVERRIKGVDHARFLITVHDAIEDYHDLYHKAGGRFHGLGPTPTAKDVTYWRARYPRALKSLATPTAQRFGLPELWIYSIMRQESRYDARQISHTAALGIMQMIPATARIVAKALDREFFVENFFDPGVNVLFCTYYLGALLEDFKGQIVFASAGYNAGAPPIKRFMDKHRGMNFDELVEMIAYNEARNYGRKVAEHLIRYAAIHLGPVERAELYRKVFPDQVDYDLGTSITY